MRPLYAFRNLYVFLAFSVALPFFASAQMRSTDITWFDTPLNADTSVDGYYQSLPASYNTSTTLYPIIIYLHGDESIVKGRDSILTNSIPKLIVEDAFPETFRVGSQEYSFIVIAPHFTSRQLTQSEMGEAIDAIIKAYRVDPARIYLTGMSRGSEYTWEYAGASSANATRLAAIVPISNGQHTPVKANATTIGKANLPVLATHNTEDYLVPFSITQGYVDWVNEEAPTPLALLEPIEGSAHEGWTETYNPASTRFNGSNIYQWMLQYTAGTEAALPVTLTNYKATQTAPTEVTINWETGSEVATGSFTLERSATQNGFTKLAAITATQTNSYTFVDKNPLPGANFYRLSQTEANGTTTFFPVLRVALTTTAQPALSLYPNPVTGPASIQLNHTEQGSVALALFTSGGALVQQWTVEKTATSYQQTISLSLLKPGSYILQAQGKTFRQTLSFIKK